MHPCLTVSDTCYALPGLVSRVCVCSLATVIRSNPEEFKMHLNEMDQESGYETLEDVVADVLRANSWSQ
jgi:hypothetical protein